MPGVKVGLQTKLLLLLVLVSLVSMLAIALVSYHSGRQALEQNVYDRLTGIREARKQQLLNRVGFVRGQVGTLGEDKMVLDALKEFKAAVQKLPTTLQNEKTLPPVADREKALRGFYEKDFLPAMRKNHDADEPSDYSRVHATYHPRFRKIAETFGYANLMFVDLETATVLYSVRKTTEFGTELTKGAYSTSHLAELIRTLQKNKDPNLLKSATFEAYAPNLNRPASFIATPVGEGANLAGILVFQFPIDSINRIVAGDYEWERDGLGKTGEVVLVAHDHKMRSESRFYHEDAEAYLGTLTAAGYPKAQVDRIRRSGTTILAQEIHSEAVEDALAGETHTEIWASTAG
jgi:hypothetical protein